MHILEPGRGILVDPLYEIALSSGDPFHVCRPELRRKR